MGDFSTDREKIAYLKLTVGLSDEDAFEYLHSTNWRLDDDAVRLFLSESGNIAFFSDDGVGSAMHVDVPRLPSQTSGESSIWRSSDNESSNSSLESLFSPPTHMMHQGSFDDARMKANTENKWLLVNVQSMEEFSSHLLNRDTWSNETLVAMIQPRFIVWQVNHDEEEGMKVCAFYELDSLPAILVVDPFTGQKMRSSIGMRDADTLFADLLPFMDEGPKKEHEEVLCHGIAKLGFKESSNTDKDGGEEMSFEYLSLREEPKGNEDSGI